MCLSWLFSSLERLSVLLSQSLSLSCAYDVSFYESSPFFMSSVLFESSTTIDELDDVLVYRVLISPVRAAIPNHAILEYDDVATISPFSVLALTADSIQTSPPPISSNPHSPYPDITSPNSSTFDPVVPNLLMQPSDDMHIAFSKGTRLIALYHDMQIVPTLFPFSCPINICLPLPLAMLPCLTPSLSQPPFTKL